MLQATVARETAEAYLKEGGYSWNSGMFVFTAKRYLQELQQHRPGIFATVQKAWQERMTNIGFIRPCERAFIVCPSDLIDYAVMQNTKQAAVVPAHFGWSDVGSWDFQHCKANDRKEHLEHARVHRPWGWYEGIDQGERFQVKRIMVEPGGKLSLQMHHRRTEHWIVVSGAAKVTVDGKEILLTENQSTYISLGHIHRHLCREFRRVYTSYARLIVSSTQQPLFWSIGQILIPTSAIFCYVFQWWLMDVR